MKKSKARKVVTRTGATRIIYPDNAFNDVFSMVRMTVDECAVFFGVDKSTIRRWRNGSVKPPRAVIQALRMVAGFAPTFQTETTRPKEFTNWRFINGKLWTDEGMGYTAGEIRSIWYMEQELKIRREEMDKMQQALNELRNENAKLSAQLSRRRALSDNVISFPGAA